MKPPVKSCTLDTTVRLHRMKRSIAESLERGTSVPHGSETSPRQSNPSCHDCDRYLLALQESSHTRNIARGRRAEPEDSRCAERTSRIARPSPPLPYKALAYREMEFDRSTLVIPPRVKATGAQGDVALVAEGNGRFRVSCAAGPARCPRSVAPRSGVATCTQSRAASQSRRLRATPGNVRSRRRCGSHGVVRIQRVQNASRPSAANCTLARLEAES
jgi:hypothetical protein